MKLAAGLAALTLAIPTLAGRDPTALGVGYICAAEAKPAAASGELTIVKGMGSGGFPADTRSAEAQAWFDYGLKLYHGFYHDEAKVAFRKAAEADPNCALCVWGEALSLGPTLNFDVSDAEKARALGLANQAAKLAKTDAVRALAATLQARYQPGQAPIARELAYGKAVSALVPQFPRADDVATLAAHALLIPARSDNLSGVQPAIALLEPVLKRSPNNTAAIHYYIHATEFAGKPALALPYAERLAGLAPEASHLVHMGAHTLFRVGRYEDVAVLNAAAMKTDAEFAASEGLKGPISAPRYYLHNSNFGLAGALMSGDAPLAVRYADHAPVAFPVGSPADRRTTALGRSYFAYGRFAPAKALGIPAAGNDQGYLAMMRHYARGEAFAAQGDAAAVVSEASAIRAVKPLADQQGSENIQAIAAAVLDGRAAMLCNRPDEALKAFEIAAKRQESAFAFNFDPPPWWYPVRRSLAAAQLKAGRAEYAAREAQASLARWPADPLALQVLADAEAKLGKSQDAAAHRAAAKRAWRGPAPIPGLELI
jgi:tetratricopeptide (TPR) repeat protein